LAKISDTMWKQNPICQESLASHSALTWLLHNTLLSLSLSAAENIYDIFFSIRHLSCHDINANKWKR
jgi:hypothetical protein